jgi:hypothetical protein
MAYSGIAIAKTRPASAVRSLSRRGSALCFGTVAAVAELSTTKNAGRLCRYEVNFWRLALDVKEPIKEGQ